jgi:hypothetical protein
VDQLREPLALHQLHCEEADARGLLDAVERHDVRVVQSRQGLGFSLKALEP